MSATLKDLYNALKADGRFSEAKDFGTFASKMNERGYSSMVYNTVRNAGADVPDIATFRKNLGVHVWKQGEGKKNVRVKPTSAVGKAAQSVEQERWGNEIQSPYAAVESNTASSYSPTESMPQGRGPLRPMEASEVDNVRYPELNDNSSALVRSMALSYVADQENKPTSYTKPGALVDMEKRRQKRTGDIFEQTGREYANEERERLDTPAFNVGNDGANQNIVKTQGQLEKEIADSANLLANDKSVSDYLSNSIFGEFNEANKRALQSTRGMTGAGTPGSEIGLGIARSMLENQQKDPEKLLKNLQEKTRKSVATLFSSPEMRGQIEEEARRLGISTDAYVQNALAPKLQERLAEEFDKAQIEKYLPKGTAEYVVSGVNDSLIGTLSQMMTMTKSQRQYMQRANAMTQEGLNPYMDKPGTWTNAARGAVSFVADAPVFGLLNPVGGKVAAKIFGNGVAQTARMANASWYGRMGYMAGQGAVSQGTTGFLYGGLNSAVQNYSTGDDTSMANTIKTVFVGGLSEGASWATMGAFGGFVGGGLYKAGWNGSGKNLLRNGATKIGSDVLKLGAEGVGMHLGGNVAKVVRGEDTNWFSTEGVLEDCANVVALKLSHAHKFLGKVAGAGREKGKDGKRESYADFVARNLADYFYSDATKGARFKFTEEEKKEFRPYIDTYYADVKSLLRTRNAKASDADNEKIKTAYDQIMADENISWDAKAKYNALVMGTMPSTRPMMDYWNVATNGDKKAIEERAKDGTLLSRTTYDTADAKDAIAFRLLQNKERQRMNNAYSGLLLKDLDNKEIQEEYMRSLGYDFENPNNPRNKVIEESMAKAREDYENGVEDPEGANNIYKGWLDFAFERGALINVEEGFLKERGIKFSDFNRIAHKNPWERTDEEHQLMLDFRRALEKELFPENTVHEEQSQLNGKDVSEENDLGGEKPNEDAVKGTLAELKQAENDLQELMDSNEVFKSEYERLQKQGLSNAQIYQALIDSGMTQEELTSFAKYINANAKVQGMVDGTQMRIVQNVRERVMEWSYKGELNGEKQSGENMVYVTDDKGRTLVVASGDVAFDSEGKPKEDVGDMLVVYDTATGEVDFVSAKDIKFHTTESAEDFGKRYTQHLQELNSQAYVEAAQEQQGGENVPQQEGTGAKPQEQATEEIKAGSEIKIGNEKVLLSDEIDDNGKQFVLTNDGKLSFGEVEKESGLPSAPILLSEGMITNPSTKDGYGLVHIEARHGDQIRKAGYKSVVDFIENVAKNYDVIKEGNKRNGQQTYRLQLTDKHNNTLMIELSSDGSYWNINTAGIFKTSYGKKNKEVYNRHTTEKQSAETAGTSQGAEQSGTQASSRMNVPTSSLDKDSNSSSESGENKQTLTFKDGSPIPMTTDSKGRQTGDLTKMSAEHGAEYLETTLGEMTDEFVDGKIKAAEKAIDKAKKKKVDMSGDVGDVQEAVAKKNEEIAKAEAELNMYTGIKKAMTEKKVKAAMEAYSGNGKPSEASLSLSTPGDGKGEGGLAVARTKFEGGQRIVGNKRTRTLVDGTKIKGHYELVEAESLTPSHDATDGYKKSEGFPLNEEGRTMNDRDYEHDKDAQRVTDMIARNYDGQAVDQVPVVTEDGIVVDGNGRTMAGQKAAKDGTDGAYLEALKENAENYGFTAEQVDGMKHPRLVLVSDEKMTYDTATFAKFNRSEKKAQDNTQQAVANSKKLTSDEISAILSEVEGAGSLDAFFKNPAATNSLLKRLIDKGVIGLNEVAALREGEDKLSAQGKDFVKNLLLGSVFSEDTIRMMGKESELKTKALNGIRAVIENMKLGEYALTSEIDKAVQLLYEARQGGVGADALLRTPSMFGDNAADRYDPISQAIALALEGKAEDFRELMLAYNKNAEHLSEPRQLEMFGEKPTKEEFINEFLKLRNWKDYETRHSSEEGAGDAGGSKRVEQEARGGSEEEGQQEVAEGIKTIATEITKRVGEDLVVTDEKTAEKKIAENETEIDGSKLRFQIKTPEQRKAAENAYNWAQQHRPSEHTTYAVVDMSRPDAIPQYFEKKDLAKQFKKYWSVISNGEYKLVNLDKTFEENVKDFTGDVPDVFNPSGMKFHKESDEEVLERLDEEPKVKVYRAMQVMDGKLYPPMAASVNGKRVEANELGVWIRSDENPDLAIPDIDPKTGNQKVDPKTGELKWKFKLDKGGKDATGKKATNVNAAYNPYWHTSRSPLNDQFKSAWIRPNIVIVECEVPKSELTSGYKAERAKDAVGEVDWKSGSVSGEIYSQTGRARKVILSRWCKPIRVLSDAEFAQKAKEYIGEADVEIPENVVTPKQRVELEKLGVKIGKPEKGVNKSEQIAEALEKGLLVDNSLKETDSAKRMEFRTKDGEVYGFTDGKKIYLDTKKMKPDTALHEYTHLWGGALRRVNPKEWENVKGLLDKVDGLKEEIQKIYPELKGDDVYDEMLAMFSGREGTKKLEDVCRKLAAEEGKRVTDSAKEQGFIDKVKEALQKFWKATADLLHVHFTSAEDVADKVLADWARGFDPREKKAEETGKDNGKPSEASLSLSTPLAEEGKTNGDKLRYQKAESEQTKADEREKALRDEVVDHMRKAGLDVSMDTEEGQQVLDEVNGKARLSAKKRRALETASLGKTPRSLTVVSSADGAKVLKSIDTLVSEFEKSATQPKTFVGDVAKALGAERHGSASEYATFETKNGRIVTIRLANHNAKVSNFDNRDESEGISIVVSPKKSEGMTNDGAAHVVEYYYDALKLRRADGKPLAEIVRSIKQALYSGEFEDTTGLAERQEVNAEDVVRYNKVYHGSGADFDHFDHSHMGEGEGAQAYGWGTYVTEVKGIGRTYAEQNSKMFDNPVVQKMVVRMQDAMANGKTFEEAKREALERMRSAYEKTKGDNEKYGSFNADYEKLERLTEKDFQNRHLYTVDIPADTGENYLDWEENPTNAQIDNISKYLEADGWVRNNIEHLIRFEKDGHSIILNGRAKGKDLYEELKEALGSDKKASLILHEAGFVGIKYPADFLRGGREDGKQNYVIFNEADAKITDHVRFFRTANGEAYGYTIGGKIYIDPRIANAETPIHEYAHLWATALRKGNAEEWQNVVGLMKDTTVWDEVKKRYPELKDDNDIADEVLATYSGRRGSERLREEMGKADGEAKGALARVKQAIEKFWKNVADMLHIHYTSAEEVADRVMKDLLDGVDPRKVSADPMKGMEKAAEAYREERNSGGKPNYASLSLSTPEGEEGGKSGGTLYRMELGKTFSESKEDFDGVRDRAVEENGIVMPNLKKESVKVVKVEKHNFSNKGEGSIDSAKKWAYDNIVTKDNADTPTMHDGTQYVISKKAIDKYLSKSAIVKSDNLGIHLSVLPKLIDVIHESIEAEIHPDYKKGEDETRNAENGYGNNVLVHRLYGAVELDDKTYRVKTTMQEFRGGEENKPHSYEVTKIELLDSPGTANESDSSPLGKTPNNSISVAKLLAGVEKSYDKGKKLLDESKDLTEGEMYFRFDNKNSQPREQSESDTHISAAIAKTAEKTGGKVKQVHNVEEIDNEQVRKDIESGKEVTGWYDEKTGEVHLYMPNIHDSYTAEKTVWHETVGHKGMRGLLGDKFHKYLRSLWMDMDSPVFEELHKYVKERMAKEPLSMYDAIEEFIADAAEKGKGEAGFWNNVKNKVADALHEIGYRLCPNVKDVKYMLWLAKNVQKHGNDPVWKMRAEAVKWKIDHDKTEYTTTEGGEIRSVDGKAHDFESMTKEEWNEATDGEVHYRTSPSAATALDRYHRMLGAHGYMAVEAFADNMAAVDRLMRALDPTIKRIEDVSAAMNPYMLRTVLDGAASDKMQRFEADVMQPLDKYMARLIDAVDGKNDKEKTRNFNLYMIKKHGLERNRVFFVRDAVKNMDEAKRKQTLADFNTERKALGDQLRKGVLTLSQYYTELDKWICQKVNKNYKAGEHDYSGMHGLYGIADKKTPYNDIQVQDEVMSAERAMEGMEQGSVEKFWGQVKVATQYSLDEDYQNGFVTKENHESVSGMFDWYVPLRKFDAETAEDVYGYVTEMGNTKTAIGPAIVKAKGRKSLSETNILAQIGAMANYAVVRGSQNKLKQAFALFVRNKGGQGLVTETKAWVEKVGTDINGNPIWEEVFPDIQEGDTADKIAKKVEAFEQDMKQKQAQGLAKNLTDRGDIGFKFERKTDKDQHFVDVAIAGKTCRFVINGNPRAAQALNGQLENGAVQTWIGRKMKSLTRFMAQMATSYNPEFVLRNAIRDAGFALQNVTAREGARYGAIYKGYYLMMLPVGAGKMHFGDIKGSTGWGLYAKYRNGTLDTKKNTEKWFKEFMENGGETGFVQIKNLQQWEKQYKRDILRERSLSAKSAKALKDFFIGNVECVNEVVENMARFAAYCASRHMKRSIQRCAYDAKQVSVNFNRHGSGDAISSFETPDMSKGKKMRRDLYGFTAGYLRNYSMFFNAGAQGTQMMFSNIKNAPVATIGTLMATPFAFGIGMAMLNAWRIGNEDEKERKGVKDPYAELPEYIRRNNLCIYLGEGKFATIPLAIEHRAFYGLGDIVAGLTTSPRLRNERNVAMDITGCLSQLFPVIDFMNSAQFDKHPGLEAVKGVMPTTLAPFAEWLMNSDWKGAPIRRVGDYSENRPSWKNAYSSTPERLIALNKWANATTNDVDPGNPNMKGADWADALTDPSMLNHIIGTLGGGATTTTMRVENAIEKGSETEWNELPLLRNLGYVPQERTNMARTKARWYNYVEAMNKTIANYNELGNKNVPVDERIANIAARYKFENSDEYRKVDIIERTEKQLKRMRKLRNRSIDDKAVTDGIDQQTNLLIQDAVSRLEEYDRQHKADE